MQSQHSDFASLNSYQNKRDRETIEAEYFLLKKIQQETDTPPLQKKIIEREYSRAHWRPSLNPTSLTLEEVNAEIALIEEEKRTFYTEETSYSLDGSWLDQDNELLGDYTYHVAGKPIKSPRFRFLKQKLKALHEQKKKLAALPPPSQKTVSEIVKPKLAVTLAKPFVGVIDDIPTILSKFIPSVIAAYLLGGAGGFGHVIKAYESFGDIKKTIKKKDEIGQFKTRLAASTTSFLSSILGSGLGAYYIAGTALGVLIGGPYISIAIFGLMTLAAGAELLRDSYSLHQAIKAKTEAQQKYDRLRSELPSKLKIVEEKRKKYKTNLAALDQNAADYGDQYAHLTHKQKQLDKLTRGYQTELEEAQNKLTVSSEKQLKAENKVAYATLEFTFSTLILVGTIFAAVAMLGLLSTGTFGAPLILGGAAAGIGIGIKLFQIVDKHYDHAITRGIRNAAVAGWNKLFPSKKPKALVHTQLPTYHATLRRSLTSSQSEVTQNADPVIDTQFNAGQSNARMFTLKLKMQSSKIENTQRASVSAKAI